MTVDLPAPPSANALWHAVPGRRRVKTAAYRKWRKDAGILLAASGMRPFPERTPLCVVIEVAINRTRDVDNAIKPLVDALQEAGVVPDDRWVDEVVARRVKDGVEAGWCRVGVSRMEDS